MSRMLTSLLIVSALCACSTSNDDPPSKNRRAGPAPAAAETAPAGCTQLTGGRYSLCGAVSAGEPTLQGSRYGVSGTPDSHQSMVSDRHGITGGFHATAE